MEFTLTETALRLLEQSQGKARQFEKRALQLSKSVDRLEAQTLSQGRAALRELNVDIRREILSAADNDALSRGDIYRAIDRSVDRFVAQERFVRQRSTVQAVDLAQQFRQKVADIAGVPVGTASVPPGLAQDINTVQDEAMKAFGDDLRSKLKVSVTQSIAKGLTPRQVAGEIVSKQIVSPRRAADEEAARGALARFERINRTSIRQAFGAAKQSQAASDQQRTGGVKKIWITQGDAVVREAHAKAGRDYSIGGRIGPIPLRERFQVAGEGLLFPGDPVGSPGNVINCRCTSIEILPEIMAAIRSEPLILGS